MMAGNDFVSFNNVQFIETREKSDAHAEGLESLWCLEMNRNRELEAEVQHLRSSLSTKEVENSDLQRQCERDKPDDARDQEENRTRELISELESLRSSLAMKENENEDLQNQLVREKYTIDALNQVSVELSTKLASYESNTAEKCSRCSALLYQQDMLQHKLDAAKRNSEADKKRVKELERTVELLDGVRSEKLSLEEQLSEWRNRSQSAQQQCNEKQAIVAKLKEQLIEQQKETEHIQVQCQKLADEAEDMRLTMTNEASTKKQREQHFTELTQRIEALQLVQTERNELLLIRSELEAELASVRASNEDVLKHLTENKTKAIDMEIIASTAQKDRSLIAAELNRVQEELASLRRTLHDRVAELRERDQRLSSTLQQLQGESQQRGELQHNCTQLSDAQRQLTQQNQQLQELKAASEQDAAGLRERLQRIESELSACKSANIEAKIQHVEDAQLAQTLTEQLKNTQSQLDRAEGTKRRLMDGLPTTREHEHEREHDDAKAVKTRERHERIRKRYVDSQRLLKEQKKESARYRLLYEQQVLLLQQQQQQPGHEQQHGDHHHRQQQQQRQTEEEADE